MTHRRLHVYFYLLLGACTESHSAAVCDPSAAAGDSCSGAWTCPVTSIEGSTGTHFMETRCEDGTVRARTWSERPDPMPDPIGSCDPDAPLGAPCEGGWECPEQMVEGSTGTHHEQIRCMDGIVVRDFWIEPPRIEDAGMPPIEEDAGERTRTERAGAIECGDTQCDRATEGCLASCQRGGVFEPACVVRDPDGRWPAAECPSGDEQFPRFWLTCDGPEDCAAGEGCHITFGSLGQYAYCNEFAGELVCHDAADCPPDAPRCAPTESLPGYSSCIAE